MGETPEQTSGSDKLIMQLYVSGMSSRSMEAIENIKSLCNNRIPGKFELEIIDLYKNPEAATEHQIIFSPSLIKLQPPPKRILIGTFTDTEKVMTLLGILKS